MNQYASATRAVPPANVAAPRGLEGLTAAINANREVVESLEKALDGVLRPSMPSSCDAGDTLRAVAATSVLTQLVASLEDNSARIRGLMERLEL